MEENKIEKNVISKIALNIFKKSMDLNIPLSWKNYKLWFEYFKGENNELALEIDRNISDGATFDTSLMQYLYDKYCGSIKEKKLMRSVFEEMVGLVQGVFEEISDSNNDANEFNIKLADYSDKIQNANDMTEAQSIIEALLMDTNQISQKNNSLQLKLSEARSSSSQLEQRIENAEKSSLIDGLTNIYNRKAFDIRLKELFMEYKDEGKIFSAVMLDIDHFKKFNDTYGHTVGDEVLKVVGSIFNTLLKGKDFSARYGGEEFVILLPETSVENAFVVADKLRAKIAETKNEINGEKICDITASLGIACINSSDTLESVMKRADKALYLAKESGRNNVKVETEL